MLFECLTGKPPFWADHPLAVMAKILLDETPRVTALREDAPDELADLLDRMLLKYPAARLPDGAHAAEALAASAKLLEQRAHTVPPPAIPITPSAPTAVERPSLVPQKPLGSSERQLMSVVLVGGIARDPAAPKVDAASPTMAAVGRADAIDVVYAEALSRGGWAERLVDGTTVVSLPGEANRVDQATGAARCALAVRRAMPDQPMVLTTGRTDGSEGFPMGEMIERGVALLAEQLERRATGDGSPAAIGVDELTAGLLDRRFKVRVEEGRFWLLGEADPREAARTLLGQRSPLIGRDAELERLTQLYVESAAGKVARFAMVTAPAGMGKSRIRQELLQRLESRFPTPTTLLGRGDPTRRLNPLALIAGALTDLFGLRAGEGEEVSRHRVRSRVARHVKRADRTRVAGFLGELVGVRFPDGYDELLQESRADRTRTADQIRTACQDFFAAELESVPVVMVLDDLHAADAPSIAFVEFALRQFAGQPLFVLGLARPEVVAVFPELCVDAAPTAIALPPLTAGAARELAQRALGTGARPDVVESIVARAEGNVFFIEELVRGVAEGRSDQLPATMLAVSESLLASLKPLARQVLRCASVLGSKFSTTGIRAILHEGSDRAIRNALGDLIDREVLYADSGAEDDWQQFAFVSETLRVACYEELTDADRVKAHRLAGEWLESIAGPSDASEVARHYRMAGDRRREAMWHLRAAEIAFELGDLWHANECAERAATAGAGGLLLARIRLIQAEAMRHAGDHRTMATRGVEAMQLARPRTPAWWTAAANALGGNVQLAQNEVAAAIAHEIVSGPIAALPDAARAAVYLLHMGRQDDANLVLDAVIADGEALKHGAHRGWIHRALAYRAMYAGHVGDYLAHGERALAMFERSGDVREAAFELVSLGFLRHELGLYLEAEDCLRSSLAIGERLSLPQVVAESYERLGTVLIRLGRSAEAERCLNVALSRFQKQGNRRLEGHCRRQLGLLYIDRGALDQAFAEIMHASQLLSAFPPLLPTALAACARVFLATGSKEEAVLMANDAAEALARVKTVDEGEAFTLLTHAETLFAVGQTDSAMHAIRRARDRIIERAAQLDVKLRHTFLEEVRENKRTVDLALEWLRKPPSPHRTEAPKASSIEPVHGLERSTSVRAESPFRAEAAPGPRPKPVIKGAMPIARPSNRPVGLILTGNADRQQALAGGLNVIRADVFTAKQPAEVIRHLESMPSPPDRMAIFVDPLTPDLDGKSLIEQLRTHRNVGKSPIVVAGSAAVPKLRGTMREWGADGYLPLASKAEELVDTMRPFFAAKP